MILKHFFYTYKIIAWHFISKIKQISFLKIHLRTVRSEDNIVAKFLYKLCITKVDLALSVYKVHVHKSTRCRVTVAK